MPSAMPSLLDSAPMLRSRDIEETRAFLAKKAIGLNVVGPWACAARIDARLNGVYLHNVWLGYIDYRTRSEIQFSEDSSAWLGRGASVTGPTHGEFWIHIPVRGHFEARSANRSVQCNDRQGLVISPSQSQTLRTDSENARLGVSIRREALESCLAAILAGQPGVALEFDPVLPVEKGHGARLLGLLRWATSQFDCQELQTNGLIAANFEQLLMNWLLLSQPSNYSDAVRKRDCRVAPRDVRRATDYIHAHLAEPITLSNLVAATGVPGRTLLKHFREVHGVPPMRYVRIQRLQRVRDELSSGRAHNVLTVALRWGFAHPGRLSIEYRERFGEAPSVTLARARRA